MHCNKNVAVCCFLKKNISWRNEKNQVFGVFIVAAQERMHNLFWLILWKVCGIVLTYILEENKGKKSTTSKQGWRGKGELMR